MQTYDVWMEDWNDKDDCRQVSAFSPRHAAEQYTATVDRESADYSVLNGVDARVHVRTPGGWLTFIVTGEAEPVYTACCIGGTVDESEVE